MNRSTLHESLAAEVVSLATELYLPKGTEHFLSDLHGEYEAFSHIMRSASGVIRRKLERIASDKMTPEEISELMTVVYYPEEKLALISPADEWYDSRIRLLIELLAAVSAKYTREKVRLAAEAVGAYGKIIFELLYIGRGRAGDEHISNSIKTLLRLGEGATFVNAIASLIKRLAVDRLHIVGDIFDRGARPDIIIEELTGAPAVDIEWGNHDILWLGAAAGSGVCIMGALLNSLTYSNTEFLEEGYSISLAPLLDFANKTYDGCDLSPFIPKGECRGYKSASLAKMRIAAAVIMWKLEGELILRNPDFLMNDRLLLDKISGDKIEINGKKCKLKYSYFPTLDKNNPYRLTKEEEGITEYFKNAFLSSKRLLAHAKFLLERGSMYKVCNRNLLFHGAIPMSEGGEFLSLPAAGGLSGRALMDHFDEKVRDIYSVDIPRRERSLDLMWFLWCGKNSPLSGRERIATLERLLTDDKSSHTEPRNFYYNAWQSPALADKILAEFSLGGARSHIINGHIPVKRGETPIKAGGKLIVIDGGFCGAYHGKTGIAGYTLIYNSEGMRISAHEPFAGKEAAIEKNSDIHSDTAIFETTKRRIKISEVDEGRDIMDKIAEIMEKI